MKKLLTAAMLVALAGHALAQDVDDDLKRPAPPTTVQQNFEMPADWINIRDYLYLPNKAKLILELNHVEQYEELKSIDTLLMAFMRDIAFYKDSLTDINGSVRIDYTQDDQLGIRKIRFKKHAADGTSFMARSDEKAKLKIDQDTVRIYVRHHPLTPPNVNPKGKITNAHLRDRYNKAQLYQLTFCLNHYEDIAKIVADKQTLQHAIDTVASTKRNSTRTNPHKFPSSARYNPYATQADIKDYWWRSLADVRFKQYGGLVMSEEPQSWKTINRSDKIVLDANLGMGLIRHTFAPYGEIALSLTRQSRRPHWGEYNRTAFSLSASSYFMFERSANNDFYSKPNWFVNASISEEKGFAAGAGYLFAARGGYFKGITTRYFFDIRMLKKGFTLSPELIVTNNFQQVIPALTIKVF